MKRKTDLYYASWEGASSTGGIDVPIRATSFAHAAKIVSKRYASDFDSESKFILQLTKTFQVKELN